jgi:outer membrane protein assembly factor BamA
VHCPPIRRKKIVGLAIVVAALAVGDTASAQEGGPTEAGKDSVARVPGNTLVPLPVVFYQPETGIGFGAVVSYYFRLSQAATAAQGISRPSTVSVIGIYTAKKQIITSLGGELYLGREGRTRLLGDVGYVKFPTKFWGIGNNTPDEDEEDYTPETVSALLDLQREVFPGWFLGGTVQAAYRKLTEVEEDGQLAGGTVPGAEDGGIVGLGLVVTRDTRDNIVFPRRGGLHRLSATLYDGVFGSDYDFGLYALDLRGYLPLFTSHVLALRALGMASSGAPPFDLYPELGGDVLLRGYFQGRFRDRQLMAFQGEYRAPLVWRMGIAWFFEVGQVASTFGEFDFDRFKLSAGGGLRFQLSRQEGLNVRADYGWGFDVGSGGFYLSIGEAF